MRCLSLRNDHPSLAPRTAGYLGCWYAVPLRGTLRFLLAKFRSGGESPSENLLSSVNPRVVALKRSQGPVMFQSTNEQMNEGGCLALHSFVLASGTAGVAEGELS